MSRLSTENEANPELVVDVKVPDQSYTAFINTLVTKCGETFEVWIRFGRKNWQIADGTLEQMNAKRDRIRRFIADPFAPCPSSVEDFVGMARGL